MKRWIAGLCAALMLTLAPAALAETDGDCVYTLLDADGRALTQRAGRMYVDDEYISGDDKLYRVAFVDDAACTATAEYLGPAVLCGRTRASTTWATR